MSLINSLSLRVDSQGLWILDQAQLPLKEEWVLAKDVDTMIQLIRGLNVRGAPLIGVAASLQLAQLVRSGTTEAEFERSLKALREARPTAVNLMNAMDRLWKVRCEQGMASVPQAAEEIFFEDVQLCERMAKFGGELIQPGERVLTHCNTGGLATVGVGTALGCIKWAHTQGRLRHVWVDETRPLLQGARLTTWELSNADVPFTLICDNMAAALMQKGQVSRVMVGADRIARNGDFANKVGTYSLAVLCQHHGIPFHVVAPYTTIDWNCTSGQEIPIEERDAREVRGDYVADVWNPAFDVTPARLVTSWVLDQGNFYDWEDVCGR